MALSYTPQYLDFSGLTNALGNYTKGVNQNLRREQWNALADVPGLDPRMMAYIRQAGPDVGPQMGYGALRDQMQMAAQRAQQDRAYALQLQQMAESRRMHDSSIALQRQQLEKNSALQPYQIEAIKADIEAKKRKADMDAATMRLFGIGGAAPDAAPPVAAPPPPSAPSAGQPPPSTAAPSARMGQYVPAVPETELRGGRSAQNATAPQTEYGTSTFKNDDGSMSTFNNGRYVGSTRPQYEAPAWANGVQKQSLDGTDLPPGIILAQSGGGQPSAPQPPAPQQGGSAFDRMSASELINAAGLFAARGNKPMADYLTKRAEAMGFGKEARNDIDKKSINSSESLFRLTAIQKSFNEKFLTTGGKARAMWSSAIARLRGGQALSEGDRQFLVDSSTFMQDAATNINMYIKEITGAQMSEAEAKRLTLAQPNAGTMDVFGLFSGDDPVQFKAKLDNAVNGARLAAARYNYMKKNGIPIDFKRGAAPISLEQMDGIMDQRAKQIFGELRRQNPGIDPRMLQIQADRSTAQEFGI